MDEAAKRRFQAQGFSRALQQARLLDPEMPTQTLEAFLHIAASSEDMNFRDLAELLGMSAPTATRNVAVLAERRGAGKKGLGLVDTYEDAIDRRIKRVTLTAKGRRFLESLMAPLENINGKRA